jgi:hypothetical protein
MVISRRGGFASVTVNDLTGGSALDRRADCGAG